LLEFVRLLWPHFSVIAHDLRYFTVSAADNQEANFNPSAQSYRRPSAGQRVYVFFGFSRNGGLSAASFE